MNRIYATGCHGYDQWLSSPVRTSAKMKQPDAPLESARLWTASLQITSPCLLSRDPPNHFLNTAMALETTSQCSNILQKNKMLQAVQEYLFAEIIEKFESAWAAPAVLRPKPEGGIRLCIDSRHLNVTTSPDQYPVPQLDNLLNSTDQVELPFAMDLRAGDHQIRLREDDQKKTWFVTPFGIPFQKNAVWSSSCYRPPSIVSSTQVVLTVCYSNCQCCQFCVNK